MCTLNQSTEQIKQLIRDRSNHPFLKKHILAPTIDMDRILILNQIYNHIQLSERQKHHYIATIMFIQIALDTHELVPITAHDQENETEKQLTVLAGDYYSGLYYLLLSELEDIEMIQLLAGAIKQVNEYKMRLYYREASSLSELMTTIKKIESLLYCKVTAYLNEPRLIPIIEEWLLLNRLCREKESILENEESVLFDYLMHRTASCHYTSVIKIINEEIEHSSHILEKSLVDLPLHLINMKPHIQKVLIEKVYNNTSMAEEG